MAEKDRKSGAINDLGIAVAGLGNLINDVGGSSALSGAALTSSDDDWQQAFNANLFAFRPPWVMQ